MPIRPENKARYPKDWKLRSRCEYDEDGNATYYENSYGYWARREYDEKGNVTYYENSHGEKEGTKRGSCEGKVIEVDGKKYKLMEL